ncbi:MAG: YceI family protein [Bacteroidia bacterium]|nr:YceI family protein [Bacteroidia bacterium]
MKKLLMTFIVCFLLGLSSFGQKYFTKNGKINFDATSSGSPEKIEAVNKTVTCVMDIKTGNIQFSVLMKGFEFERALMQEHFNENYVESDKFPKAEFKGTILNNTAVNYLSNGSYAVKVEGKLTIHGETKDVSADGKLVVQNGKVSAAAGFKIILADYKITIPGLVADKVSKTASIDVSCLLEPLK